MAQAPSPPPGSGAEADPSMDDILASIRRILNDDDKAAKAPEDGVLMLDPSMMVDVQDEQPASLRHDDALDPLPETETVPLAMPVETVHSEAVMNEPTHDAPMTVARDAPAAPTLVAPAAAAAAANSVDALKRTLAAERSALVSRGVVTIEDLVREEIRPVLKAWLDAHLPPLVERLVQAEIERVVARNAG